MSSDMDGLYEQTNDQIQVAWQAASAALGAYFQVLVGAICDFTQAVVPGAVSVRLTADVDWRWVLDAWLDADGEELANEVEPSDEVTEMFSDLFTSAMDELPDGGSRAVYGYIRVRERTFVVNDRVLVQA